MCMQKALLVVNPSSGGEQAQEYEQLMQENLKKMFDEVEMLHTKKRVMQNSLRVKLRVKAIIVFLLWEEKVL